MQMFQIRTKFEQNGEWSEREADLEGYLVKKSEEDDMVKGYVKVLYPTAYDPIRYIKGLYSPDSSLVFLQMSSAKYLQPICYCFPNIEKEGYWSPFSVEGGCFPIIPGKPCSSGRARIQMNEIASNPEIEKKIIFAGYASAEIWTNKCLMADYKALADLLGDNWRFQMQLHCGKW